MRVTVTVTVTLRAPVRARATKMATVATVATAMRLEKIPTTNTLMVMRVEQPAMRLRLTEIQEIRTGTRVAITTDMGMEKGTWIAKVKMKTARVKTKTVREVKTKTARVVKTKMVRMKKMKMVTVAREVTTAITTKATNPRVMKGLTP